VGNYDVEKCLGCGVRCARRGQRNRRGDGKRFRIGYTEAGQAAAELIGFLGRLARTERPAIDGDGFLEPILLFIDPAKMIAENSLEVKAPRRRG
jgi:hypothetical protein